MTTSTLIPSLSSEGVARRRAPSEHLTPCVFCSPAHWLFDTSTACRICDCGCHVDFAKVREQARDENYHREEQAA